MRVLELVWWSNLAILKPEIWSIFFDIFNSVMLILLSLVILGILVAVWLEELFTLG